MSIDSDKNLIEAYKREIENAKAFIANHKGDKSYNLDSWRRTIASRKDDIARLKENIKRQKSR